MNRRLAMSIAAVSAALAFAAPRADAQTASDLVGAWTLVSATAQQGGTKVDTFGPDPSGVLMFSGDGHFAVVYARRDLPKIAANSRASETPEEAQAIARGSLAAFGTYAVTDKVLVLHIEGSTFPNWAGTEQRRRFSLSGDELTYTTPGSAGMSAQVTLRRAR